MKAFDIEVNGKILDYRIAQKLNLDDVTGFFSKKYKVIKIWQESRHVLGIVEKDGKKCFLKLSTTEGISAVTQIEHKWNDEFNKLVERGTNFWVPASIESGFYKENLFYFLSDYFEGKLLAERPLGKETSEGFSENFLSVIDLSEFIQTLSINPLSSKDGIEYRQWFLDKVTSWFEAVPENIIKEFSVDDLLTIVKNGYQKLEKRTRHGDFTPWHMFNLGNGRIGLIDGEHAMKNGVEYYDVGYLIQRTFSVLQNEYLANQILKELAKRNYDFEKLKVVLACRAIGGFTDEALINEKAEYKRADKFKKWVLSL